VAHSVGQYVCFLDSDDKFLPNYLTNLHAFLEKKHFPEALVVSDYFIWDGNTSQSSKTPPIGNNVAKWLFDYPVSPSRSCVHRSIFEYFKFREDIVIVEDTVLWVSISTQFPVLFLPEALVLYRVHESNSVNRSSRAAFDRYAGLKKFFEEPLSTAISNSDKRKMISDVIWRLAEYHSMKSEWFRSYKTIIHSIGLCPIHRHTKAKLYLLYVTSLAHIGISDRRATAV